MKVQLSDHFTYPKLFRFVFPSVVMMVFTSIYGVVDGYFVSNYVGKTPFAAINLVMPSIMLMAGVGFMFGTGGTALVAMTLGTGERDKANRYFSIMVEITLIIGLIVSVLGVVFMRPIALLLGADEEMLPYCLTYGRCLSAFIWTFMLQSLFQSFMVTAEKPQLGLIVTVAAGVTNMVLDALFVGFFRWGVLGAAMATNLSQIVGGVIPLIFFISKNDSLLRLKPAKLEWRPILRACTNGISEMVNNVTASIVGIAYNLQLLRYAGENGLAAYGVIMYIEFIFVSIFVGYSIGSAPLVGYHYGAENHDELKNLLRKSITLTLGCGVLMFAVAQLLIPTFTGFYVGYDAQLSEMTIRAFRIFAIAYLVCGLNIYASSFFTALNNGLISALISFLRTFVFKMAAVLILPVFFLLDGIWWAGIIAELMTFAISLAFIWFQRKKYCYL